MKTVCIYHNQDLDGWMSAAIVQHWWQKQQGSYIQEGNHITNPNTGEDSIDFIGYNYGEPIPDLSDYDKVIMCDISFPKETMLELGDRLSTNFIWIDHHQRTIDETNQYLIDNLSCEIEGLVTEKNELKAACELTWFYFFSNEEMPEIVRLLGRYDCFGHKNTNEEKYVLEFQYGARMVISNYEDAYQWLQHSLGSSNWMHEISTPEEYIWEDGQAIYKYLCTEAKQTYKNGFEIEFNQTHFHPHDGIKKFICFNKERFNPVNFGIDYHKDGYDGAACFWYANDMWNFSIYNDNGLVDCSVIAKQYGGGGHKGAAGFRIKNLNKVINVSNQ